jgi:hypothetical protein
LSLSLVTLICAIHLPFPFRGGSEFAAVLAESYEVLRESETGTWFETTG